MKKSILTAVLAGAMTAAVLTGCAAGSEAEATPAAVTAGTAVNGQTGTDVSGSKEIGVVFCDLNNPVFVVMKESIEKEAAELGYTATILNSEGSSETELQNVQNLISRKVGAIMILANDSDTAVNSAKAANQAGIPVIGFNRPINNETGEAKIVTQVITDNVKAGETAANEAIKLLEDIPDPQVAILRGTMGFMVKPAFIFSIHVT